MPIIPRTIHFLWFGHIRRMPLKNIRCILEWRQKHPNFEINFWVDEKTEGPLSDIRKSYQKGFEDAAKELGIPCEFSTIQYKDITKEGVASEYSRYEVDRLRPNFGAIGDLLRHRIQEKFGGVYVDSDVYPGEIALDDPSSGIVFDEKLSSHQFFYDPNSQNTGLIGSDFLVSTINSPVMEDIRAVAEFNYLPGDGKTPRSYFSEHLDSPMTSTYCSKFIDSPSALAHSYDSKSAVVFNTPILTGPSSIKDVIEAYAEIKHIHGGLNPISPKLRGLRKMPGAGVNDASWTLLSLYYPPSDMSLDERKAIVYEKIIDSLRFEANIRGFLRLDDHLNNMIEILKVPDDKVDDYVRDFLRTLEEAPDIKYEKIQAIQMTRYSLVLETFYKLHNVFHLQRIVPCSGKEMDLSDPPGFSTISKFYELKSYVEKFKVALPDDSNMDEVIALLSDSMLFVDRVILPIEKIIDDEVSVVIESKMGSFRMTKYLEILNTIKVSYNTILNSDLFQGKKGEDADIVHGLCSKSDNISARVDRVNEKWLSAQNKVSPSKCSIM